MKDAALEICPREKCPKKTWGKGRVKRVMGSGAGIIFKGSGFYITDYRSDKYKEAAKKDTAPAPASTAAAATTTSEAKTVSKTVESSSPKKETKPKPSGSGS